MKKPQPRIHANARNAQEERDLSAQGWSREYRAPAIKIAGAQTSPTETNGDMPAGASPAIGIGGKPSDFAVGTQLSGADGAYTLYLPVGGGLESGFKAGTPDVVKHVKFSSSSLPDGPDEFKKEAGTLAHAAITAVTLSDSVPQTKPEDWVEHMRKRGRTFETAEEFLLASEAHLRALALDELAAGKVEHAERLSEIERRFAGLRSRCFGSMDARSSAGKGKPPIGQTSQPTASAELPELLGELQLPDQPENPKRVYETSRCVFRGGYVASELLDPVFLNIAQRAAPVATQNPGASATDFLELLRTRSPYSEYLRIESPHMAAAELCGEMSRDLDRYPETRPFKTSEHAAELNSPLDGFAAEFRALADADLNGKAEETARLNEAHRSGLPLWKGKRGFAVEFPDLVPIFKARLLAKTQDLAALLDPKGLRGAPKNPIAEMTRRRWKEMGRPKLDAKVCDDLAKLSYPREYEKSKRGSKARKRLRDRVGRQVRPLMNKPTTVPAT